MVPEGWAVHEIGSIARVAVGRDVNESRFSVLQTETHHFPVFSNTVENSGLYGFYDFEEYPGDAVTVVGRGVGIGKAFYKATGFGAVGRLVVLFPQYNAFCSRFMTDYINERVNIFSESSGIPQLPGSSLAKYKVTIPPLPEQQKIADILGTWDRAVETTEALLANARTQKRALMQSLLTGTRRFPGFEDHPWREVRLGMCVRFERVNRNRRALLVQVVSFL
jgi:type I restriction enzyme, S subunit